MPAVPAPRTDATDLSATVREVEAGDLLRVDAHGIPSAVLRATQDAERDQPWGTRVVAQKHHASPASSPVFNLYAGGYGNYGDVVVVVDAKRGGTGLHDAHVVRPDAIEPVPVSNAGTGPRTLGAGGNALGGGR